MAILANTIWGILDPRPDNAWQLTSGSYAVNLVLQIMETR
jgi:hypothetical protein